MEEQFGLANVFFQRRWPDGFSCPHCAHNEYYLISTRKLPLYECRLCRRQTTVTAGTVMDKTRISLKKWALIFDVIASEHGTNAKQLAKLAGIAHSTAWNILKNVRKAIGEAEAAKKLMGTVHSGLHILAPKYIFIFLPHRHYSCERVVSISASLNDAGQPIALKLKHIQQNHLIPGWKLLNSEGKDNIRHKQIDTSAVTTWLNANKMDHSPIRECLLECRDWMNRLFHGVASKYLQHYLNEFTFRWNMSANMSEKDSVWDLYCLQNR